MPCFVENRCSLLVTVAAAPVSPTIHIFEIKIKHWFCGEFSPSGTVVGAFHRSHHYRPTQTHSHEVLDWSLQVAIFCLEDDAKDWRRLMQAPTVRPILCLREPLTGRHWLGEVSIPPHDANSSGVVPTISTALFGFEAGRWGTGIRHSVVWRRALLLFVVNLANA
jgi:uncharacterized membrane protein YfbV (UPF0208 family)